MITLATKITDRVRREAGTDFPFVHELKRVKYQYSRRAEWIVVVGLCNGIPFKSETFRTFKAAKARFAELDGVVL